MRVELKKRSDGAGLLRCTRETGDCTWQKQTERHAPHFALHDLTHFAVEKTLGYLNGFFGLLQQGWNMEDVTGKGARGPLPSEAVEVEEIVGCFDAERSCRASWTADEFNHYLRLREKPGFSLRTLTQVEVEQIKKRRQDLFAQWSAIRMGESLELEF